MDTPFLSVEKFSEDEILKIPHLWGIISNAENVILQQISYQKSIISNFKNMIYEMEKDHDFYQ
ncbi:MAG: hypothetical protein LBG96_15020 [Tannerella sp.]|jgi:hypothetical protein|nr:hypothetical protein [Tannerella sp.]